MTKEDKLVVRKAQIQRDIEKQIRYLTHKARFKTSADRRLATWKSLHVVIGSPRDSRYFDNYNRLQEVESNVSTA